MHWSSSSEQLIVIMVWWWWRWRWRWWSFVTVLIAAGAVGSERANLAHRTNSGIVRIFCTQGPFLILLAPLATSTRGSCSPVLPSLCHWLLAESRNSTETRLKKTEICYIIFLRAIRILYLSDIPDSNKLGDMLTRIVPIDLDQWPPTHPPSLIPHHFNKNWKGYNGTTEGNQSSKC